MRGVVGPKRFNLSQVHIEILAQDGRWETYTDFQHEDVPKSPDVPLDVQQGSASSAQVEESSFLQLDTNLTNTDPDLDDLTLSHDGMSVEYETLEGVGLSSAADVGDFADLNMDWITEAPIHSTENFSRASLPSNHQLRDTSSLGFYQRGPTVLSQLLLGPTQVAEGAGQFDLQAFDSGFPALQDNQSASTPVGSGHSWAFRVPAAESIHTIEFDQSPLWGSQWLQNLPFKQFERDLKANGRQIFKPI